MIEIQNIEDDEWESLYNHAKLMDITWSRSFTILGADDHRAEVDDLDNSCEVACQYYIQKHLPELYNNPRQKLTLII